MQRWSRCREQKYTHALAFSTTAQLILKGTQYSPCCSAGVRGGGGANFVDFNFERDSHHPSAPQVGCQGRESCLDSRMGGGEEEEVGGCGMDRKGRGDGGGD